MLEKHRRATANYLQGLVGQRLYRNERKALTDKIYLHCGKRKICDPDILNGYFAYFNIPYQINEKYEIKTTRSQVKKRRYWEIQGMPKYQPFKA